MTHPTKRVVVLHGWGGTFDSTFRAAGWEAALRAQGLEPVGVDLPGHSVAGGSHDPADYSDLAAEVAANLPDDATFCVAFSLGAKIALELAVRDPGRFKKIVLGGVGNNIFAPETAGTELVQALLGECDIDSTSEVVRSLLGYIKKGGANPRCLAAVVSRPHNPRHSAKRLARITAQVLLVNGDKDAVALPDDRLRSAVPSIDRILLKDCEHIGLTDDARFIQAAARFLGA